MLIMIYYFIYSDIIIKCTFNKLGDYIMSKTNILNVTLYYAFMLLFVMIIVFKPFSVYSAELLTKATMAKLVSSVLLCEGRRAETASIDFKGINMTKANNQRYTKAKVTFRTVAKNAELSLAMNFQIIGKYASVFTLEKVLEKNVLVFSGGIRNRQNQTPSISKIQLDFNEQSLILVTSKIGEFTDGDSGIMYTSFVCSIS